MASTTRQTAAARKRTPAKPAGGAVDFEPIRIAADDNVPEERVPLFYIGDTEYTIPKTIPKGVALQYLRKAAQVGHELATAPLLIRVLGEDAYTALEESNALTSEQLESIIDIIVKQALGNQEDKGGKAGRG
ncbi:hypothetical protein [Streptomyces sp. NPDC085596]|uniref:hypothetical protein n=1 Tax=Streptomyces sp. NPDC085596 TaxID=3365731 RepID=UPI0037D0332D